MHHLEADLAALAGAQLQRQRSTVEALHGTRLTVDGRSLLGFCSNDYLGLAQHPVLVDAAQRGAAQYGVGAGASPLVCGHSAAHAALELELARFVEMPRALFFGSGYVANIGIIPALVGAGDAIFSDALNHACLIDGIRLSKAQAQIYPHQDLAALAQQLASSPARRKLVVSDAVFSMDGCTAPLPELLALCVRHDAWLLVDDAHGFGVLGPHGQGSAAHFGLRSPRLIYMATLGKAAGCAGAFVAGDAQLIEWLMQRSRSYIFATALPAMLVEAVRASLRVIQTEGWRRTQLQQRIAQLRSGLSALAWHNPASPTAIQPLIVGSNTAALAMMDRLKAVGLWVPAIRPPTVALGTARLRISLSANHTPDEVDQLLLALASGPVCGAACGTAV
jgi:8-amino-7-oxononanoate synthase